MARRDTPTAAYQTSLDQVAPALERHLGPLGATVRLETSDAGGIVQTYRRVP